MKPETFLQQAITLGLKAYGQTSPNPLVGAVVVKNAKVVGFGYHKKAGMPHAEVIALRKAGSRARNADLYVNLEPCCHIGRTPPCTDTMIKAGIKRVFFGMVDPNPKVSGKGLKALKKAGIKCIGPILENECRKINRAYIKWITTGMPYVTAKIAITLDGKIADANGDSKWITNEQSRRYAHWLRAGNDAVMVGAGTFKKDRPRLNVRLPGYHGKQPVPIVVSLRGVRRSGRRSNPVNLLRSLGSAGFQSILCEGGSKLHSALFKAGLVDEVIIFIAPKLLGEGAKNWLGNIGRKTLKNPFNILINKVFLLGDNVVIEASC